MTFHVFQHSRIFYPVWGRGGGGPTYSAVLFFICFPFSTSSSMTCYPYLSNGDLPYHPPVTSSAPTSNTFSANHCLENLGLLEWLTSLCHAARKYVPDLFAPISISLNNTSRASIPFTLHCDLLHDFFQVPIFHYFRKNCNHRRGDVRRTQRSPRPPQWRFNL